MSESGEASKAAAPTKGQWQNLGVEPAMAKALTLRGFKTPTPIQRATLPHTLSQPPRDVLGMARTGSGKTLAYLIPLLQRLRLSRARHANSRSIILVPTRELALQVLKAGKDISRGMKVQGGEGKRPLSWAMIIGGDPLDKQFAMMSEHPDIIIATPGRLLHVVVEMRYSMADMDTVIYDEADRLFELGFQVQLQEILSRLPTSRQSMLFSATLPSSVAEFVRAGLANPAVIRLDADVKINPDLTTHFFRVSGGDKDAGLMVLLEQASIIPSGEATVQHQAIVFVATKHHVEYLVNLLTAAGFSASHVYGSLDQVARQRQLQDFRDRKTSLLIVTDVAARGLDIPIMDHVINYDFPPNARVFIHRVGRTARGGRKGTAWSILDKDDLPYYADLAVNLNATAEPPVLHTLPRQSLDAATEAIQALSASSSDLDDLRAVMRKGDAMYRRSRSKATATGYRTARQLAINDYPLFPGLQAAAADDSSARRAQLLSVIDAFRPATTGITAKKPKTRKEGGPAPQAADDHALPLEEEPEAKKAAPPSSKDFRDTAFYLPQGARVDEDKMYSIVEPTSDQLISSSVLDLQGDEGIVSRVQRASQLKWDKKRKRFTQERDQSGEKGKMIKTESGAMLPATFDSGRYKEWRSKNRSVVNGKPDTARHQHTSRGKDGGRASGGKELPSAQDLHKKRQQQAQRAAKNARPTKKRK